MSAKHRLKMHKKAKGGKINKYNAVDAPETHEAEDTKEGFKKGGRKHKKEAGHAEGKSPKARHDKMKRGGSAHKKMAAGGSPYTAAHKRTPYMNKGMGEGHEGIGPERDPEAD